MKDRTWKAAGIGYSNELYHHGVKGMRWGQRRYVDEYGNRTALGQQRYVAARSASGVTDHGPVRTGATGGTGSGRRPLYSGTQTRQASRATADHGPARTASVGRGSTLYSGTTGGVSRGSVGTRQASSYSGDYGPVRTGATGSGSNYQPPVNAQVMDENSKRDMTGPNGLPNAARMRRASQAGYNAVRRMLS